MIKKSMRIKSRWYSKIFFTYFRHRLRRRKENLLLWRIVVFSRKQVQDVRTISRCYFPFLVSKGSNTCLRQVPNKFGIGRNIFSFSYRRARFARRCIVTWPCVCTKPVVPRGYRIIEARISQVRVTPAETSRKVPAGTVCISREGIRQTRVRKHSESTTLSLFLSLRSLSHSPCFVKSCPDRDAFVVDTSRLWGSMSATRCR